MNLDLTEEQELLRDTFAQLLDAESSFDRVRAAEATGFDAQLWKHLVEVGALGVRVPEEQGGLGGSLLDAVLLAEQAGRHLVSGPLLETEAVCSGLSASGDAVARGIVASALAGDRIVTLAPRPGEGVPALVPGGAAASVVVGLDGSDLVAVEREAPPERLVDIGSGALASWDLTAAAPDGKRTVLAGGAAARAGFERMREEWRLLTAAALAGLARRAIEIAAAYATERIQFDRPIGSFQAVAHPLADLVTAVDGGAVLVWRAVEAIARRAPDAAALVALAFGWLAEHAPRAAHRALHTHGGYGLSDEYDVQLFHRRAKAWALSAGDPTQAFVDGADRIWGGQAPALPEAGAIQLDFGLGEAAERFREEARRFLDAHPASEEMRVNQHNFDGHDPAFHRRMAEEGLLFASWPRAYGGRGLDAYEVTALMEEMERAHRTIHAMSTTSLVGQTLIEFGSEELKREVLPRLTRGEALCSLGFTEPGSGSDVAAAVTRAVRDGEEWVINGQKMFTSGANIAQYVFLLTRTNAEAPKHRGLTMFLVPLDTPGIDIQPIHTLSNERTNATYYADVRVPDRYRIGPVDGGWAVLGHALHLEHGGSGAAGSPSEMREMIEAAVAWARGRTHGGRPAIEHEHVREVLGRAAATAEVTFALSRRQLWCAANRRPDRGEGAMVAAFKKDAFTDVASRLMDLAAPESVLQRGVEGALEGGALEFGYRLATAFAIYGGTAEILRSIVAQSALGMPRSRG